MSRVGKDYSESEVDNSKTDRINSNPFRSLPRRVQLRDVTLRDGLQSLPRVLPLTTKLDIYNALASAGLTNLQVTSFVSSDRVPQLADAELFFASIRERPELKSVLVANMYGFERAIKARAEEIEAVVSVSEAYNEKNAHRTRRHSLNEITMMAKRSSEHGAALSVAIANCYHCVFEGTIEPNQVLSVMSELADHGVRKIALCDTTGYATPDQVYGLSSTALTSFRGIAFGAHLHDTRGRGIANAMAALTAGIDWFDAALAGLGGSPFAPGMGGNVSLESLTDTLSTMDIQTGIDWERLVEVGNLVALAAHAESR